MLNIKLEKFNGPLGLLLQLIENQEFDITEVSLAKIAGEYLDYIKSADYIEPEDMADFLVVAARLLLIKSKALLPYLQPEEEEEIAELEQQLRMYREFLEATKGLEKIMKREKFMFVREFDKKALLANLQMFSPPKKLKVQDLKNIFQDLIKDIKPYQQELKEEKIEAKIRIEDKIKAIQKMVIDKIKFSFSKILNNSKSKTEIVVSFLAVLELMKQHDVVVEQRGLFSEIIISKNN